MRQPADRPVYDLRLLGAPLLLRGEEAVRLGRKKALGLLAYLAFGKRACHRDTLAALFWPDHDQAHARGSLRRLLSGLRRELDEALIPLEEERVGPLDLELMGVDIEEFQMLLALARARSRAPGRERGGPGARELLERAVGLYGGEFLAGFSLGECGTFSDWQFLQAEYLRRELCAALANLVAICEAAGETEEAVGFARRLVREDPLNEEAHCALMRLYAASGRREEALHQYRVCAQALEKELQLEPEEATVALCEAIRHSRPAAVMPERVAESATSLGGGGKPRLAVLPFAGLAAGGEEWLSDGMTDALITELSRHDELEVISHTSSRRYQGTTKSLRQVAAELGADHLLEGAVLKAGDQVRVSAQLVEAASDRHVWAESFRGRFAGILELQEQISRETAGAVLGRLVPARAGRGIPAVDPRAREACMLGDYTLRRSESEKDLRRARDYFRQAIDLDPHFAEAYAGLAFSYFSLGGYGTDSVPTPEVRDELHSLIRRALGIDPDNLRARMVLAGSRAEWDWDWAGAGAEFENILKIDPNHVETLCWYANMKLCLGRFDEQLALISRARRLNPIDPGVLIEFYRHYRQTLQFRRALEVLDRLEELRPGGFYGSFYRAWVYLLMGRYETAISLLEKTMSTDRDDNLYEGFLAYAYGRAGRKDEALKLIREMTARRGQGRVVWACFIGLACCGAGLDEEALDWLEQSYRDHDVYISGAAVRPLWGELHWHPRYQAIVRRLGLPLQLDYIRTALAKMQ
jgi:TolB-like protein